MATIIHACGGSTVNLLASLTSVPTSSTAISGTESWKKYDAIYYEFYISRVSKNPSIFTNLILTKVVSLENEYFPLRVTSTNSSDYININCFFSENAIKMNKGNQKYDVTKVNIYGVKF